jgi:transcriptional regulator with XRE-family HTH domain
MAMTTAKALHRKWMKNPAYKAEYEALSEEFALIGALIEARDKAGLTQAQLAARMNTTQAAIARLESGRVLPSTRTLQKFAKATGTVLKISFQPRSTEPSRHSAAKSIRRTSA